MLSPDARCEGRHNGTNTFSPPVPLLSVVSDLAGDVKNCVCAAGVLLQLGDRFGRWQDDKRKLIAERHE